MLNTVCKLALMGMCRVEGMIGLSEAGPVQTMATEHSPAWVDVFPEAGSLSSAFLVCVRPSNSLPSTLLSSGSALELGTCLHICSEM